MNNKFINKLIKEETASSSIVEYSIVLPICLFVILFIFMVGYMLNQRAVLDAAAYRAILIAQKVYADPKYLEIVNIDLLDTENDYVGYKSRNKALSDKINNDPYRYLDSNYNETEINNRIKAKVLHIIKKNQLFELNNRLSTVEVHSDIKGLISKKASVTVEQTFYLPKILQIFNIDPVYEMTSTASVTITCPAEFVRNTDFVLDTVERYTSANLTEKLTTFFTKISDLFKKTQ